MTKQGNVCSKRSRSAQSKKQYRGCDTQDNQKRKKLPLTSLPPQVVCSSISAQPLVNRNLRQADVLHHRPDDGRTTRFGHEGVDLIGALADIAKQAFNRIGAADVAMHD